MYNSWLLAAVLLLTHIPIHVGLPPILCCPLSACSDSETADGPWDGCVAHMCVHIQLRSHVITRDLVILDPCQLAPSLDLVQIPHYLYNRHELSLTAGHCKPTYCHKITVNFQREHKPLYFLHIHFSTSPNVL